MSIDNRPVYTGGCQCGAVRFRIEGTLGRASVCHCRMCQKAFGNFFAPLVDVDRQTIAWTREPSRFQSSQEVRRGFCDRCGTPLTYEAMGGLSLAIGAFDDPSAIEPSIVFGAESELPYVGGLHDLPARPMAEDAEQERFMREMKSFQHPDHD